MGDAVIVRSRGESDEPHEAEVGLAVALGLGPPPSTIASQLVGLLARLLPRTITVDDSGIQVKGGPLRPWTDIGLAYETEHLYCFVITSTSGPIDLPKRSMSDADLAALRTLAAQHVVTTPETLESLRRIRTRRG